MLTATQFKVIKTIEKDSKYGTDIRKETKIHNRNGSFYLLINRLERLGYVQSEYHQIGQSIKTFYTITDLGLKQIKETREFYS